MSVPKILTIDIETLPGKFYSFGPTGKPVILTIDQEIESDRMACYAYKWLHEDKVKFEAEWLDKDRMVQRAYDLLDEADGVVTYNGDNFDIPWINRVVNEAGLGRPSSFVSVDLFKANAKHFRYVSKKLEYLLRRLELSQKMRHDGFPMWVGVLEGDPKYQRMMRRYCMQDTRIEENAYLEILPWLDKHPNANLFHDYDVPVCPTCGSDDIEWRGYDQTKVGLYRRFKCHACGSWSRVGKREKGSDLR